jgi:hypothetical protein
VKTLLTGRLRAALTLRTMRRVSCGPNSAARRTRPTMRDKPPPAPANAFANSTNWRALRACDTGKFVISRSWDVPSLPSMRSATPRMSGAWSGSALPDALEKRAIAR